MMQQGGAMFGKRRNSTLFTIYIRYVHFIFLVLLSTTLCSCSIREGILAGKLDDGKPFSLDRTKSVLISPDVMRFSTEREALEKHLPGQVPMWQNTHEAMTDDVIGDIANHLRALGYSVETRTTQQIRNAMSLSAETRRKNNIKNGPLQATRDFSEAVGDEQYYQVIEVAGFRWANGDVNVTTLVTFKPELKWAAHQRSYWRGGWDVDKSDYQADSKKRVLTKWFLELEKLREIVPDVLKKQN